MSRFNYVEYDETSMELSAHAKSLCEMLEQHIERISHGRAKSLALTSLEECFMWIGKAIRDEQAGRSCPVMESGPNTSK